MEARRLVVLSDLHLGPDHPLTAFRAHAALEGFLRRLADEAPLELVLAGDVFEMLLCPGYDDFDRAAAPGRLQSILDANRGVVAALRAFAARPGNEVTLLAGNHDPEMLLPAVREVFARAIGVGPGRLGGDAPLRPGLWGRAVGGAWVVHGDAWDPQNAIDREAVLGGGPVALPVGSRLVCEVVRALKTPAARGWVDQLKPEVPAVLLVLLYLDPRGTRAFLRKHRGLGMRALAGFVRGQLGAGSTLGSAASPAAGDALAALLAEELRGTPARERERLLSALGALDDEASLPVGAAGTLAPHDGLGRWLLRAWLRGVRRSDRFLDEGADDALCGAALAALPDDVEVVVAGHTHGPRSRDGRPRYVNSGTWTPVGGLPDGDVRAVVDALERGDLPTAEAPRTWVDVTVGPAGARAVLRRCDAEGRWS